MKVKVTGSRRFIHTFIGENIDNGVYKRWAGLIREMLMACLSFDEIDIEVTVAVAGTFNVNSHTEIEIWGCSDEIEAEVAKARAREVLMRTTRAWANPIERTCLAIDKYDSECDRFIGRVVAGTLASSQAWEPTDERAIPKEWALEKGQWFTCKETGYDVFVPYPRITYSVKRWSCYHRDKVLVKGLDSKEEALSKMLEIRSSEKSPDIFVYADMEGMDVSLKVG